MKNILIITILALAACSCGGRKGEIRITGEFENLDQGSFLIYSPDGGLAHVDTLHLKGGRFDYRTALRDSATFTIVYPNYSTLTIFAHSGEVIEIAGDALQLNAVKVSGNEENEAYTQLRLAMLEKTAESTDSLKKAFMAEHVESAVTRHLKREELLHQLPRGVQVGQQLADMTLVTRKGDTIRTGDMRGKYVLLAVWANWKSGASILLHQTRLLKRKYGDRMEYISCSLDADGRVVDMAEKRDTVDWHSVCEHNAWMGTIPQILGIRDVPWAILADPKGKIVVSARNVPEVIDELEEKQHRD